MAIFPLAPDRCAGPATGKRLIWVERAAVDRLRALRLRGEDLSDTILRLARIEAGGL